MSAPEPGRIDRAALDKIIQRAAELQTGEHEIGDDMTPDEVLALGKDVGIPARYLRQAMLEHQATATLTDAGSTAIGRWVGPADVEAQRVVQGEPEDILRALMDWMDKNELLVLQRQQSGWVSWEPMGGMQAAIRRGTAALDTKKAKFMLSRAEAVVGTVTRLEAGYAHVKLSAKLQATRRGLLIGSGVSLGVGGAVAVGMAASGLAVPFAAVVLIPAGLIAFLSARGFRPIAARVQLGLERALDFLERGGVKPAHEQLAKGPGLLELLAGEVRRALTAGEAGRREAPPRGSRPADARSKPREGR